MLIIDGKNHVLGRLASVVSKRLLEGERVAIVNAEEILISGKRKRIFDMYDAWFETRTVSYTHLTLPTKRIV